jgi:uncharacterized DUF497 family protein
MDLEWDDAERRANLEKHGLDFADAADLDWDRATVIEDARKAYPEPRYWAFAMRGLRLHVVTFCRRDKNIRVISFRKANDRETRRYGPETT